MRKNQTYTAIMQQYLAYILRLDLASSHKFLFYRERQECGEAKVFDFSMIMKIEKLKTSCEAYIY